MKKPTSFDGKKMILENYPEPNFDETLAVTSWNLWNRFRNFRWIYAHNEFLGHEFVETVKQSNNSELIGKRVVGESMVVVKM